MSNNLTIVDLFSGCGGFGLGAELAGYRTLVAIDKDEDLQSSYGLNFPDTQTVIADVANLNEKFWRSRLSSTRPTGVIGGPPCQGFSRIGRRVPGDGRNNLVRAFFSQVLLLQPEFFVMENVSGILDRQFSDQLEENIEFVAQDYNVLPPQLIKANDFGAATNRERVLIVGFHKNTGINSSATDFSRAVSKTTTVKQAISDLPKPYPLRGNKPVFDWRSYPSRTPDILSDYAKRMRALPPDGLGWDVAIEQLKKGRISGSYSTKHSLSVVKRFRQTKPGSTEAISRYPRLDPGGHCPTLRAGTGAERGSYQSMRPIHPKSARVITVREAARLQGFPDWFVFHPTKWHSFRMIGNSVPPVVSKEILLSIKDKITSKAAA